MLISIYFLVLYKEGPAFYHASYVIVIDVLDESLKRKEEFNHRSMEVTNIIGLNRLCETAGKVYYLLLNLVVTFGFQIEPRLFRLLLTLRPLL